MCASAELELRWGGFGPARGFGVVFTVRVRIIRHLSGTVDGIDLTKYLEGLTYEVGTTLANYLLAQHWAVPADVKAPMAVLPLTRTLRPPSVLVVEDDRDMQTIMSDLLGFHGWRTFTASDGIEGLRALEEYRPSLILLDLAMPRMDGVQFRYAQRRLPDRRLATVPIVVVSAIQDAPRFKDALKASDVVVKPFEADRLLQIVENHAQPMHLF